MLSACGQDKYPDNKLWSTIWMRKKEFCLSNIEPTRVNGSLLLNIGFCKNSQILWSNVSFWLKWPDMILGVVNRAQHVRTSFDFENLGILGNTERITQIMSVVWKLSTMLCKTSSDIGKRKMFPIWQRSDSNVADVNGWKTIIIPTKIALAVAKEGLK